MEESRKIIYRPPVTEVVEVKFEGIVCDSGAGEVPDMEHGWDLEF